MGIKKTKQAKDRKTRVYSISQMNTYINCGRKYKYRYIDKIKAPRNDNLIVGSAHHEYFENVLKARLDGKDLNSKQMEEVRDVCRKNMSRQLNEINTENVKGYETLYNGLTKLWDKEILPGLDPVAVEAEKWYEINGCKFVAYLDLINKYKNREEILDWKIVKKKKSDNEVNSMLQLSFYSLITDINNTGICSLTKTKKPAIHMVRSYNTDEDKIWCITVIRDLLKGINMRYFPLCSTENYLCNEKYCEYWDRCRGKVVVKKENELNWSKKK